MPRIAGSATPKYRHHKPSGHAVVTIAGIDNYLGPWRSKASRVEYDRQIGEWLAAGRPTSQPLQNDMAMVEMIARYIRFAKAYYVKDGRLTGTHHCVWAALRVVKASYGKTRAVDFGPLALRSVQQSMIKLGHSRRYINDNIDRIRRMFKWAVAEELLPPSVYQALQAVPGLRRGRSDARETEPIKPVDEATIAATLPHLPPVVADMVRFQRLTGSRPAEVCILRPRDIDRTGDVWSYRPESHKTEHHGRERVIFIGPQAQDVLRPYMLRAETCYCFAPADSERKRRAAMHSLRVTPLHYGSRPGTHLKRSPRRPAGQRYSTASYRRAIERAVEKANDATLREAKPGESVELLGKWKPNQLRHAAATEIRRRFGLEAAQVTLGHSNADVTQVYAERDLTKAAAVMREVG
jgi:integrase